MSFKQTVWYQPTILSGIFHSHYVFTCCLNTFTDKYYIYIRVIGFVAAQNRLLGNNNIPYYKRCFFF